MYKNLALIALVLHVSGCVSTFQSAEERFESVIKTNGYYYSDGNSEKTKMLEAQWAKHNINKELIKAVLGEQSYYVLTFDDVSSNKLTYITLSKPVVDGKLDEQSIKKKLTSHYRVSDDQNDGYRIHFYENNEKMNVDFLLRASSKGDIINFSFIKQQL